MEQPRTRFRFDFADLRPAPLRVVVPAPMPLPEEARVMVAGPRPWWLRPLLPLFRSGAPLRVDVTREASPVLAARLRNGIAVAIASAGGEAGVQVVTWNDGLAAGSGKVMGIPPAPDLTLVPAEVEAGSAEAAKRARARLAGEAWLVVADGQAPWALGSPGAAGSSKAASVGPAGGGWERALRVPLVTAADLGVGRGHPTPFALACATLAMAVVRRHRELQR